MGCIDNHVGRIDSDNPGTPTVKASVSLNSSLMPCESQAAKLSHCFLQIRETAYWRTYRSMFETL